MAWQCSGVSREIPNRNVRLLSYSNKSSRLLNFMSVMGKNLKPMAVYVKYNIRSTIASSSCMQYLPSILIQSVGNGIE